MVWSLATKASLHWFSSLVSASSRVYWNWVRLTRSSTERSCTGCMKSWMPETRASSGWSRRMTSLALSLRSSMGFRLIWMRPLFWVVLVPSIPMKEDRLATAGSCRMVTASACWRSAMAAKEMLWGPSEMPRITPVSCTGKKPFGMAR